MRRAHRKIRHGELRTWMPWGWSLLAHAALLGGAWWIISSAHQAAPRGVTPIFIPRSAVAPIAPVSQTIPAQSPRIPVDTAAPSAWSQQPPAPIGADGFSQPTHGTAGIMTSAAPPALKLSGQAPAMPFSLPHELPAAPPASVFSDHGNASTVAYVCDASGSMSADRLEPLKIELQHAIEALQPIQSFTIIFFKQDQTEALSPTLLMATDDNKQRAKAFLKSIDSAGETDPVAGLNKAFDARPAVIYLLSDGEFPDAPAVLRCIARRNPAHAVRINTIAFLGTGTQYEAILRQIAAENGGTFKRVTREQLSGNAVDAP
jgi:hypothetical protein